MADNIKNRTYTGTGQTFEETFKGTTKGMSGYQDAVEALAKEYARLNGLSEEQRQWLEDYINGLDDVKNSWEQINDYVQEFVDDIDTFTKDLGSVRNLFSNILKDLQPARRQATEQVNLLKNFRDLTGEIQRATVVQNGTSEANLRSLNRRVQKAKELYEWSVQSIIQGGGYADRAAARAGEGGKVQVLQAEKDRLDGEVRRLQGRLQRQQNRGYVNLGTKIELNEALRAQTEFNKTKLAELDLHRSNVELLQEEVRLGVEATAGAAESLVQQRRRLGREHPGLNTAARLAEKFGVTGAKDELESYYQQMILAQRGEGPMPSKGALLGGWIKDGLTFTGIMTALGVSIAGIVANLNKVSDQGAKLKQATGEWGFNVAAANTEFATSAQYLETAVDLANQFGQNPLSFIGKDEIARLAEAKNLLGLSAEQAGNAGIRAKIAGQNMDSYTESIVQGINRGNALNRSAVAHGAAMKEVLATSDDITLSLGNSGEALGRAIVAAKNLGMNLKDVDRIAGSLLDFESSIENEMKAQLLTGQQMNLSRARALALQNDLEGVAKEISRQGMDALRFGALNRIQQESFAKALGMSREELGRSLVIQAGISKLTDKQVKDATGMTKAQLEGMSITDKWKVATEKLMQAFTPLLEAIVPAVEFLSNIITGIAGFIGKIFSGASEGIGNVVKGLLILTGTVLTARLAFRLLGLAGKGAFAGLGAGIANTLRGVGLGIRGLIGSITPLATGGIGWAAVGMVAALGAAIAALGWGLGQAAPAIEAFGNLIKSVFEGIGSIIESTARGFKDIAAAIKELTVGDVGKLALLGPSMLSFSAGLAASIIPLNLFAFTGLPALRKITPSIKALTEKTVGSQGTVGAGNEASIRSAATTAAEERMEKIVTGIANRLNSTLNVHVDNWDIDKISRQLAVETANDFR